MDLVAFLFAFFGLSSWIAINGVFSELPLLVDRLPEGWSIGTYLSVAVQIANLGPLCLGLLQMKGVKPKHTPMILAILLIGITSCLMLGFFWSRTTVIFGAEHSLALIVLTFFGALVDCTSSVVYWPFVGLYEFKHTFSLSIGGGLSGIVSGAITWIQSPRLSNDHQLFSPGIYFGILALLTFFSLLAFFGLLRMKASTSSRQARISVESNRHDGMKLICEHYQANTKMYYALMFYSSFFQNGVILSILSYASMPYNHDAYHIAQTIFMFFDPVGAFAASSLERNFRSLTLRDLVKLTLLLTPGNFYILCLALSSPDLPLASSIAGSLVLYFVIAATSFLNSIVKASIFFKSGQVQAECKKSELFFCAACMQAGSLVGAVMCFILVEVFHIISSG